MANQVRIKGGPNLQWFLITLVILLIGGIQAVAYWIGFNLAIFAAVFLYLRYRHIPIITSLLDTDWYKFTMGQVVFHEFPDAWATYKFINRGKTQFPEGFDKALKKELKALSKVALTDAETDWLFFNTGLKHDYIEFLYDFWFDPNQVDIAQKDGVLDITISGPWQETILWEVPLMAIISELYFRMTGKVPDEETFTRMTDKADKLSQAGVQWSDFGTRRRFSKGIQEAVNMLMGAKEGFLGTSNPYFAMIFNMRPVGTYAHESVMAMQGMYPYAPAETNRRWMQLWMHEYQSQKARIALTDTLTTEVFLRDFDKEMADAFDGVRQDSGDPFAFARLIIKHYKDLGIDPKTKKIVFSDSLDADKAIALHREFSGEINCVMGIGTYLTNDCGHKPLNMVIKLSQIDFGDGDVYSVVKLSDDPGKYTGDAATAKRIKEQLGLEKAIA
jgi:nicotinate phosphoribosyltransferase